ncbi:helix-turn-helix transcriptional regulator [Moraxella nasovis]|uniref:helix-turn-helix domain-containing protein n=1 Tax=Moraxella nasovis TaxID=2904121 RepID=UPI001F61C407|nr:helix-turn-helix transcriptional regulator [Moraxella nasovis]UNU73362.1 helix-turn-helix transcriptional regulator [Moraxella nasovis]
MSFTNHQTFLASLPKDEQAKIHTKARTLKQSYELSQLRQTAHLSQKELADKMGVSQANISKIENGVDVHLSTLAKYVEALGGKLTVTSTINDKQILIA